ncbi:MAG: hypothetical protein KDD36_11555 [Flavobacteriales bacterium]|nr:hypothetical protein [Flavobacteriales bacterium]
MFDFEKLKVYHKAKAFNQSVQAFLKNNHLDKITTHQLHRASFSIMLTSPLLKPAFDLSRLAIIGSRKLRLPVIQYQK